MSRVAPAKTRAPVYVDASVLVRIAGRQANPLKGWQKIEAPISSVLIEVEAPRAIERLRREGKLDDRAADAALANAHAALRTFRLVQITRPVRARAAGLPGGLRTLDAIHVASALLWRETHAEEEDAQTPALVVATHDRRMAELAQAHDFEVIGWPEKPEGR